MARPKKPPRLADFPGETLSVMEAAAVLNLGKDAAYAAVKSGEIYSIRLGWDYRIPKAALAELLRVQDEGQEQLAELVVEKLLQRLGIAPVAPASGTSER